MRKLILGLGVVLLFLGLIVLSFSQQYTETPSSKRIARERDRPYGEWEITARFNKSDKLLVFFTRPSLEDVPNGAGGVVATILVNITGPTGGLTAFQVDFLKTEPNITLLAVTDGLTVDESAVEVGGVTTIEGNYTAYLYTYAQRLAGYYYPPDAYLPDIELLREIMIREYPYGYILPLGASLIVGGVAVLLIGVYLQRSTKTRRK